MKADLHIELSFTMRAISKEIEQERLRALCDVSALEKSAREAKEMAEKEAHEQVARPHLCLRALVGVGGVGYRGVGIVGEYLIYIYICIYAYISYWPTLLHLKMYLRPSFVLKDEPPICFRKYVFATLIGHARQRPTTTATAAMERKIIGKSTT